MSDPPTMMLDVAAHMERDGKLVQAQGMIIAAINQAPAGPAKDRGVARLVTNLRKQGKHDESQRVLVSNPSPLTISLNAEVTPHSLINRQVLPTLSLTIFTIHPTPAAPLPCFSGWV